MSDNRELQAFRLAIALTEGGGKIDYNQENPITGAYGAYQFLQKFWDYHSTTAGYPDADIKDPRVQDAVARYWFNKNFNDLGSWDLAAIAHFAGRTTAFKAKANGIDSIINIKDDTGVDIGKYVDKTIQNYNEQIRLMDKIEKDVQALDLPNYGAGFGGSYDATGVVNKEAATVLDAVSTAISEGGRKKFPMNKPNIERFPMNKPDFESQVPKQVGSYEGSLIKTNLNRGIEMQ
tara:strand:+ start:233 stop:934 length:702 start_codon:yes stop_codon:yes gene_type:complete